MLIHTPTYASNLNAEVKIKVSHFMLLATQSERQTKTQPKNTLFKLFLSILLLRN